MQNPLNVFGQRSIGIYNEDPEDAQGLYNVLRDLLYEIGEDRLPGKLWEVFEEGDEAEFYELAKLALVELQEVTDPDVQWLLDGFALMLDVPRSEDGYEEIRVAGSAANAVGVRAGDVQPGDVVYIIEGSSGSAGETGRVMRNEERTFGRLVVHIPSRYETVLVTQWQRLK